MASPLSPLLASGPIGRGSLWQVHPTFSPSAPGASTSFPANGHECPLAGGDICFQRGGHCTGGDDHRCVMSASLYTPRAHYFGETLKPNKHPTTMTQAGHVDLLQRPLSKGNVLFLLGTSETTRRPGTQLGQKKGNLKPELFLAVQSRG